MAVGQRILVVDDEASFRHVLRTYLELKGYHVSDAPDGASALRLARSTVPDLILLDLTMPETDGWSALEELKDDPELARVPVVVLTASADESSEWRAKERGAVRYVTKSANLEEVVETLNDVLG